MKKLLKKRIVQDAFFYTATNVIVQLSSLVGVLFVSRYLGPTNLGLYSFAQNYIAAFVTILSGLDVYAHWHIAKSTDYYTELILYTKQKIVLTCFVILFFLTFSFTSLPSDVFLLSLLLVFPIVMSAFSGFVFMLQYQNNTKLITSAMISSALLILFLKLMAVYLKLSLAAFVAINSFDGFIITALCIYSIVNKEKKIPKQKLHISGFLKLFKASFFPLIYILTWFVVVRVDQFFVPVYFNAYTLGVYSAAVKVIEMTNVLIVIMQSLIVPRVTLLQNPTEDIKRTNISVYIYGILGIFSSVAICMLAPFVTKILFGPSFSDTIKILQVYAWSIPGLFISYLFAVIAMSKKSYKSLAYISTILSVFAVTASFFAAKSGSIISVAFVSVVVYTSSAVIFYITWRKGFL